MANDVYVLEDCAGGNRDGPVRHEGHPDGQESHRGIRHRSGYRDDEGEKRPDDDPRLRETANDDGTGPGENACSRGPGSPDRGFANQDDRSRR